MATKKNLEDNYPVLAQAPALSEADLDEETLAKIQHLADLPAEEEEANAFVIGEGDDLSWRPTVVKMVQNMTQDKEMLGDARAGDLAATMKVMASAKEQPLHVIPVAMDVVQSKYPDMQSDERILNLPIQFFKDNVPAAEQRALKPSGAPVWGKSYVLYFLTEELDDIYMIRFSKTSAKHGRKLMKSLGALMKKHTKSGTFFKVGLNVNEQTNKSGQAYYVLETDLLDDEERTLPGWWADLSAALREALQPMIDEDHQRNCDIYLEIKKEGAAFGASGGSDEFSDEESGGFEDDM